MNSKPIKLFFCLLLTTGKLFAQTDDLSGSWHMEYWPSQTGAAIKMELYIGSPQKNILFPALLKLRCDSFVAEYEFLLVRKTIRELAISKNKYPVYEKPFTLENSVSMLNGILDYSRDLKGNPVLTVMRMPLKKAISDLAGSSKPDKKYIATLARLKEFLETGDIQLKKLSDRPWYGEGYERILCPTVSPMYFGLLDTVLFRNRDGLMELTSSKKTADDIVTVALNGHTIIDQVGVNKKKYSIEALLDTGLNILVLFADNFSGELPNKGKLDLQFYYKNLTLDLASKKDSAATFIVAQLYLSPDTMRQISFQEYIPSPTKMAAGKYDPLKTGDRLVSSIVSTSRELTFAIWDDAVEDGDSVSIYINDKPLVQHLRVTKRTQFFSMLLKPGPNTITFKAENLGSIPPNTSMLEIIDGKKRKAFNIETTVGENNLIRIFYDLQPEQNSY